MTDRQKELMTARIAELERLLWDVSAFVGYDAPVPDLKARMDAILGWDGDGNPIPGSIADRFSRN